MAPSPTTPSTPSAWARPTTRRRCSTSRKNRAAPTPSSTTTTSARSPAPSPSASAGSRRLKTVDTRVSLKAAELSGGARIVRVDSGGYQSSVACGGASGEVVVGVLYAGEVKNFVVHLHVPAASPTTFFSSSDHAPGFAAAAVSVEGHGVFVERPEVAAVFVSVDSVGGGGRQRQALLPSPVVMQHMVRFELLELVAGFAETEMP
uniref:Uncharacterized protein n=2 Tax=Oryza TaxID=4527 RepID=A0A679B9X3_9ORYZ|nr:hypothetical protein [Oryza barthii]BBF89591.1 zinc finger-like [Oryza glaberrima]BBF89595.1 zinc finger-like [Oryza glaberrima]